MLKLYSINQLILLYGLEDNQVIELLKCTVYSENRSNEAFNRIIL